MSSFLLPRTSSLVKPATSSCFPGAAAPPLLPSGASTRPLLPLSAGPSSPLFQAQGSPMKGPELSLASVHVPLESIKPSRCWRLGVRGGGPSLQRCGLHGEGWVGPGFPCQGPLEPYAALPTVSQSVLVPAVHSRGSSQAPSGASWSWGRCDLSLGCGALSQAHLSPCPHLPRSYIQAAPFL